MDDDEEYMRNPENLLNYINIIILLSEKYSL